MKKSELKAQSTLTPAGKYTFTVMNIEKVDPLYTEGRSIVSVIGVLEETKKRVSFWLNTKLLDGQKLSFFDTFVADADKQTDILTDEDDTENPDFLMTFKPRITGKSLECYCIHATKDGKTFENFVFNKTDTKVIDMLRMI